MHHNILYLAFEPTFLVDDVPNSQIVNSGATNIPEALRLVPGMIVREKTPGKRPAFGFAQKPPTSAPRSPPKILTDH